MKRGVRKKLERKGWQVGDAADLLGLSSEETRLLDLKLALSQCLRETRLKRRLTQEQLARFLQSSQSRVAKMEAGDPSVSLDLVVRALVALGATEKDLARAICKRRAA